jgi:hypothetical protein
MTDRGGAGGQTPTPPPSVRHCLSEVLQVTILRFRFMSSFSEQIKLILQQQHSKYLSCDESEVTNPVKETENQLTLKWKFILVRNESFSFFDFQLRQFSPIIQVVKECNYKHGIRKMLSSCIISRVVPNNNNNNNNNTLAV